MQPGGKPEAGETPAETLVRELREELGVEVDVKDLVSLGVFRADAANEPGHAVIADVFEVSIADQEPVAAAEIAEMRWVAPDGVDRLEIAPLAAEYFLHG
jgi:8-oxo-dGTP pyrophosphatase MutT (NUDIX family)